VQAVQIHAYGGPEVLSLDEVPRPAPGPNDLLVRVHATAVNPVDWKLRSGLHVVRYRLPWILGLDASGVVEAVGSGVTRFAVGDEVWSSPVHNRPGTYADYLCINERQVALKPANLSHPEAASLPLVGLTAYQCLVDMGRLGPGQQVLIHAGAGGVGSFAIQLAKHLGARVITTCSSRNAKLVRDLGADQVIDYQKERFDEVVQDVDLVLDSLGEAAFAANLRVLRRGGRLANITLDVGRHVARYGRPLSFISLVAPLTKLHLWPLVNKGVRARHVVKRCNGEQLGRITALCERGIIKPIIDRVLPLEAIQEAHRYSETRRARGKIVLTLAG
jgi:NADPH:quinone reductase-like Zn-dependent oxidoreductase